MSYSVYENDPTKILVSPSSTINDILLSNPNATTFLFPAGNYYMTDILNINREGIKFYGLTKFAKDVHIFQQNPLKDGINVISNNFIMQYVSVHDLHDGKISLTVASSNGSSIQNCYFYGTKTTFTIYYAGPKTLNAGQSTIDGYAGDILDSNNIFMNNVVYSAWSGDAVSFSLQLNGIFNGNVIRGGKLAIYMCKKCNFTKNIIYDSTDSGIYVSLPTHDINITNNKIYECLTSGIKIGNQAEHGFFIQSVYNITIRNNYIYDAKTNAIELNDVNKCTIAGNKLISSETFGIYLLRSKNVVINNNKFSYFDVAIWCENSVNNRIYKNTFLSVYPDEGTNVVKLDFLSNYNKIYDNITKGKIIHNKYYIPSETIGSEDYNNIHEEYYDIGEEIQIMK